MWIILNLNIIMNFRMAPQPPKPPVNLEIRAPAELLLGVPVGLQANWRHQPADLVAGLIKYEVNVRYNMTKIDVHRLLI